MRQQVTTLRIILYLTILGLLFPGPGTLLASAEFSVDASLSHQSFPQGKAARLTINVTGTSKNATIELPEIDNVRLHNQGRSSQISVVNGDVSSSVSHSYLVQALQPGSYTIPPIKVSAGGNSFLTKPIHFEVTQPGQHRSDDSDPADQTVTEVAFIRISETGSHYSGEIVPVTLKAYFSQAYRADINSLPTLQGDGVVMSQLQEKPDQTEESVNGKRYHVLTWNTSLSGIKVGEHPIRFSLDATLLIPQKRRSLSPFGGSSFFDDPFFNNSFFGHHQRKPIVSVSPEIIFKVLPLPTENQPDNFTGAIGDFDLKVVATPLNVEPGEPITLTVEISGTGNFDRVDAPVFPESPEWKTYSPTSNLRGHGNRYSDTKSFEQAIVAKSGTVNEIPALSFSYFDPQRKRFITKNSKPIPIHLKIPANPMVVSSVQPIAPPQEQLSVRAAPATTMEGLAPIHLETGNYHARIVPLFKNLWLVMVCGICVLFLLALFILMIRQRNIDKHPEIQLNKQRKLLLENDLKKVKQAQAAGDGLAFLSCCRTAIQNQLGLRWNIEPAAISLADIENRLNGNSELIALFSAAEEAAYGGATLTTQKMQNYYITLKTELEGLL
ncbi:MAG: BatD family protein [Desulforhopalus sp.]